MTDLAIKSKDGIALKKKKCQVLCHVARSPQVSAKASAYFMELLASHQDLRSTLLTQLSGVARRSESGSFISEFAAAVMLDVKAFAPLLLQHARVLPIEIGKDQWVAVMEAVLDHALKHADDPAVKSNLSNVLWILRQFASRMKKAPSYLDRLLRQDSSCFEGLKNELIWTSIKIFAAYPALTQDALGKVFEAKDSTTCDKIKFYTKVLQNPEVLEALNKF